MTDVPGFDAQDPGTHLLDDTRDLVPEEGRRLDHPRVVPAPVDLDVRPAGERRARAQQHLARAGAGQLDTLHADVLAPVHHRRPHSPRHAGALPSRRTFSVPGARPIASSKASLPRATGSRWLTSSATRTVRLHTSSAASCCTSIDEL